MSDQQEARSAAVVALESGRASLGIELGSTRIKLCLVGDDPSNVLAVGSHDWENEFVDQMWTYSLDDVWSGIRSAYADLLDDAERQYGIRPSAFGAIGVSAMMHGYLAFDSDDELLVPFRTWRNTTTAVAAAQLTELFGVNIPQRWSIAHLHQAVLDHEDHLSRLDFVTTLAGYVHWRLTGRKVLGVGDASGMFPIGGATNAYDERMLAAYAALDTGVDLPRLLPQVLVAGERAGELTADGAALLDPSGLLRAGVPFAPPEGDAGTGMVATRSIAPRTGNISAGTSIFAMIVLERPLAAVHHELDEVTTPVGDPVAMVHCNNGASELAAWAGMFGSFAAAAGTPLDPDTVFEVLLREALEGDPDAGGVLAYNHLAGEPVADLTEGRPLVVRAPDSRLTLANFMRAQVYGVFGTLSLGMRVLAGENVAIDHMYAHGGIFRTAGVAQRLLAGALDTTVSVTHTASEGGAWGMAVLASYVAVASELSLAQYLDERVFGTSSIDTVSPLPTDVAGFAAYLDRYADGLAIERRAIDALPLKGQSL